jgi:apolipoprotein N-acyltransferase
LAALGEMLSDGQILIAGAVRSEGAGGQEGTRYYNSVVAIDDSGEIVDAVDKVHLVPFGEYLPFADWLGRLGLEQLVAGPMGFAAGGKRHSIALPGGIRALPFICYEIIFPDLVAVDLASTDIIVNVTNDAWFGDTPGPYQHFRQAQVRAVETGLPLVRAANTGISGVIDQWGRVVDALAVDTRGVIDVTVPFRSPGTITRLPSRFIGVGILFGFAALALGMKLRQKLRSN